MPEETVPAPGGHNTSLNIYQRIHAVMTELDYIQKDPKKPGLQYSYASHDKVTAAVRLACINHGLIMSPSVLTFNQDGNRTEVMINLRIQDIDHVDGFVDVQSIGFGIDPQDKGPGKAISYACKYAMLKAFSLETGDDPDNDQGKEFNHSKGADPKKATPSFPIATGPVEKPLDKFNRLLDEAAMLDKTRGTDWLKASMKASGSGTVSEGINWLGEYIAKTKGVTSIAS